jgi:hypothetical protein
MAGKVRAGEVRKSAIANRLRDRTTAPLRPPCKNLARLTFAASLG